MKLFYRIAAIIYSLIAFILLVIIFMIDVIVEIVSKKTIFGIYKYVSMPADWLQYKINSDEKTI